MRDQVSYITPEGLEKLKEEFKRRKTVLRREIADRIDRAKELGDLSENAEYAEAKDEQAFNEGRILELGNIINNAALIIKDGREDKDIVDVGSTIIVEIGQEKKKYTIMGASESDPTRGFISNESPLGQAFLGRKKGEKVEVNVPAGVVKYKILEIK